jgi:predicted RNA-binding Zn ribbon-like protein
VVTELKIVGGDPALDLANTAGDARVPDPLAEYDAFVGWAARVRAIDDATAARLAHRARRGDTARVLETARELRRAVDAVFRPLAEGGEPSDAALAELTTRGAEAVARARLIPSRASGGRFELAWDGDDLERPLWPLAAAAVDLLRAGALDRLKVCVDCPWLFLDTSRNRSRRWCSMEVCGAHAKMRRYRARLATAGR